MASKTKARKAPKSKTRTASKSAKRPKKTAAKKAGASLVNFKMDRKDKALVAANAKRYTDGNVSAWIRFAAVKFAPSAKSLRA